MRAVPKMIRAYERSHDLRKMMLAFHYQGFDEWGLSQRGSMMSVYQDMLLQGELVVRPTRRLLIQDAVIITGATFPMVDSFGANVSIEWSEGKLLAARDGVCVCPDDTIPQFGLTFCDRCLAKRGTVLRNVITHRRLEIFGFHFQEWKKRWRKRELKMLQARRGERDEALTAAPSCTGGGGAVSFQVLATGFRCGRGVSARQPQGVHINVHDHSGHAIVRDWPSGVDCAEVVAPQVWGCSPNGIGKKPHVGARRRHAQRHSAASDTMAHAEHERLLNS